MRASDRRPRVPCRIGALALLGLAASASLAQAPRSGDATARLQTAVQELSRERAELQAENARLKEQLAKLEKAEQQAKALAERNDGLSRQLAARETQLGRATLAQEALSGNVTALQARLEEVIGKYRELAEQLRGVEAERAKLTAELATEAQTRRSCQADNVELADIADEALDRYEDKGCFSAMLQKEPLTGIKRARVENLVEGYRDQVEALRARPAASTR